MTSKVQSANNIAKICSKLTGNVGFKDFYRVLKFKILFSRDDARVARSCVGNGWSGHEARRLEGRMSLGEEDGNP